MYLHNSKYLKFCSWWFEKKLLGYSYSNSLKECFLDEHDCLLSVKDLKDLAPNSSFKCVGQVRDVFISTSRNGNRYLRFFLCDETGNISVLFSDSGERSCASDFLKNNILHDDDIVVAIGNTGEDGTPFASNLTIINTQIYTSTRSL